MKEKKKELYRSKFCHFLHLCSLFLMVIVSLGTLPAFSSEKDFKAIQRDAKQGHAEAQYRLGLSYMLMEE